MYDVFTIERFLRISLPLVQPFISLTIHGNSFGIASFPPLISLTQVSSSFVETLETPHSQLGILVVVGLVLSTLLVNVLITLVVGDGEEAIVVLVVVFLLLSALLVVVLVTLVVGGDGKGALAVVVLFLILNVPLDSMS